MELDDEAESRALRILRDAERHGGLLARAVRQLQVNCRAAGRQAGSTWMGRLRRRVRQVWPNFRVELRPSLHLVGVPQDGKISRKYVIDKWQRLWKTRQERVIRAGPSDSQQDYVLHEILRQLTSPQPDGSARWLTEAIFPTLNKINHSHMQTLIRFLSGMADFARWNSHESRWSRFPGLRDSELKRCCLFCKAKHGRLHVDTEWHCVFNCSVSLRPRNRFRLALRSAPVQVAFQLLLSGRKRIGTVSDLAELVIKCRMNERLVCDLARFVVDSLSCRQQAFRKLSVRDILPTDL